MLKSAEFRDDLDVVSTVHTPKGIQIFVFFKLDAVVWCFGAAAWSFPTMSS